MATDNQTTNRICLACDGSGACLPMLPCDDPANSMCETCKGNGTIKNTAPEPCPECGEHHEGDCPPPYAWFLALSPEEQEAFIRKNL